MANRLALLALPIFLCLTSVAAAVDLDSLSASDRRIYCFAYVVIDLELRERAGLIDGTEARRQSLKMSGAIYRRDGSENFGAYDRRINRAVARIVAEQPTDAEFARQVGTCRALYRL